jgi:hypothetical protein
VDAMRWVCCGRFWKYSSSSTSVPSGVRFCQYKNVAENGVS